jgi:hypothetical protein
MSAETGMRWVTGAALLTGFAVVGFLLLVHGPHASFWPDCLFHQLTGLHCVGCGMTRALHATLEGNLIKAFGFNPVVMGMLAIGILAVLWELFARLSGRPLPLRPRMGWRGVWVIIGVLLLFWVLRNVALWPFTMLAPS